MDDFFPGVPLASLSEKSWGDPQAGAWGWKQLGVGTPFLRYG